mgnify:CR=1 FL=1
MAGQRPEWTSLLFRRLEAEHLTDELPPDDQTLDFISTLSDLADLSVFSRAAYFVRGLPSLISLQDFLCRRRSYLVGRESGHASMRRKRLRLELVCILT